MIRERLPSLIAFTSSDNMPAVCLSRHNVYPSLRFLLDPFSAVKFFVKLLKAGKLSLPPFKFCLIDANRDVIFGQRPLKAVNCVTKVLHLPGSKLPEVRATSTPRWLCQSDKNLIIYSTNILCKLSLVLRRLYTSSCFRRLLCHNTASRLAHRR